MKQGQLQISKRGVFNEPRKVAIYLTRILRKERLDATSREYSLNQCSSASSSVERVKRQMVKDRRFKKRVDEIKSLIVGKKGQS